MELTKEYFDQQLDKKLDEKLDKKLAQQTEELKAFTQDEVEKLAIMVNETVVEPMGRSFDHIETRLDHLEGKVDQVGGRLDEARVDIAVLKRALIISK